VIRSTDPPLIVVAPRVPLLRLLGLFFVAGIASFVFVAAFLIGYAVLVKLSGHVSAAQLEATLKNPASSLLQACEIAAYVMIAAIVLWRLPRITHRSLRELGLRSLRSADGIAVAITLGILVLARILFTFALGAVHQTNHVQTGFANFRVTDALAGVLACFTAIVAAPFAEELLFRGVLFGALRSRLPAVWAALLSALLFGLVHGDAVFFPYIALLGFVNAMLYERTGNLIAPMIVHATNNTLPIVFLIIYGT